MEGGWTRRCMLPDRHVGEKSWSVRRQRARGLLGMREQLCPVCETELGCVVVRGCGLWTAGCLDSVRLCFDSLPKRNGRDESSWVESLRVCRRQFTCMPRTLKLETVGPPLAVWQWRERPEPFVARLSRFGGESRVFQALTCLALDPAAPSHRKGQITKLQNHDKF